jgi:phasin family protein
METIDMMDFKKMFANLPSLNTEAVAATQERNLDSFLHAGHVLVSAAQTVMTKQMAALHAMVHDSTAVMRGIGHGDKDLQVVLNTQFEFMTSVQQRGLALVAEIAEITQKSGKEAFEILSGRAKGAVSEVVSTRPHAHPLDVTGSIGVLARSRVRD